MLEFLVKLFIAIKFLQTNQIYVLFLLFLCPFMSTEPPTLSLQHRLYC